MELVSNKINHELVNINSLKGWSYLIWFMWGERSYPRNEIDNQKELQALLTGVFLLAISFLGWLYFPFKITWFIFAVLYSIFCPFYLVHVTNQICYLSLFTAILAGLGIYFHAHWGFSVFHHHLERYICWSFFIGASLAVYRRVWNGFIWRKLDKVACKLYKQKGLDVNYHYSPINNYEFTYDQLAEIIVILTAETNKIDSGEIKNLLAHKTEESLSKVCKIIAYNS